MHAKLHRNANLRQDAFRPGKGLIDSQLHRSQEKIVSFETFLRKKDCITLVNSWRKSKTEINNKCHKTNVLTGTVMEVKSKVI